MRPAPQPLTLHARCRVAHVGTGEVLFVGQTSFAQGVWVGVHLDERVGKNDGSVQGKRYFECEHGYGLFVRPSQVHPEASPKPAPTLPWSAPRTAPSRTRTVAAPRQVRPPDESPSVARIARMQARQSATPRETPRPLMRSPVRRSPEPRAVPQTPFKTPAQTPFRTPQQQRPVETPRTVSPDQDKKLRAQITLLETQKQAADARIAELEGAAAKSAERASEASADARDAAAAAAAERDALREQLAEAHEGLEMATLDREMAEERADALAAELKTARDIAEDLTLELQLRDECAQGDSDAPLTLQNSKMREALIRLREVTSEQEAGYKAELAALRRDLAALDGVPEACAAAKAAEAQARAVADELREQLELAHSAEDMIEQLTEKNGALESRVAQLTAEVRDLEALRSVSDELEQAHIDTETELQAQLDASAADVAELEKSIAALHSRIADDAHTISRFRELVASLAREVEGLRRNAPSAPSAASAASAPKRPVDAAAARAPLIAVAPARDRIAAAQAHRRLELTSAYLSPNFFEVDAAAIDTLLFFERVCTYSDLIKHTLEAQTDVQEHLADADEALVAQCELRHALAHVSALARQIAAVLASSPPDVFAAYATAAADLQHADARLNAALDALQDDRFDERAVASDCSVIVPQLEAVSMSLADIESDADLAAKEVGSATLLVHDVDTLQAALAHARHVLEQLAADPDVDWRPDTLDELDSMRQCVRAVRPPTRRIQRRLASLYENGETVAIEAIDTLPELGRVSSELVSFATKYAQRIAAYALEVRGSTQQVDPEHIAHLALESMHAVLPGDSLEPVLAHSETLAASVDALLAGAVDQDNVICIAAAEPWRARALELGALAQHDTGAAARAAELEAQVEQLSRDVRARQDAAQASHVKIERLERQVTRAQEAASDAADLRLALAAARDALEAERSAGVAAVSDEPPRAPADVLAELDGVRRALHHVRRENMYIKSSAWRTMQPLAVPRIAIEHSVPEEKPPSGVPQESAPPPPAQALQELAGQLVQLTAAPKVVDLSGHTSGWRPARATPAGQLAAQQHSRASAQWHIGQLEAQLAR